MLQEALAGPTDTCGLTEAYDVRRMEEGFRSSQTRKHDGWGWAVNHGDLWYTESLALLMDGAEKSLAEEGGAQDNAQPRSRLFSRRGHLGLTLGMPSVRWAPMGFRDIPRTRRIPIPTGNWGGHRKMDYCTQNKDSLLVCPGPLGGLPVFPPDRDRASNPPPPSGPTHRISQQGTQGRR